MMWENLVSDIVRNAPNMIVVCVYDLGYRRLVVENVHSCVQDVVEQENATS